MRKLFALDCHISVVHDLQWMAKQWGDLQIDDWSMSNHAHLIGKERHVPRIFENDAWKNLNEKMVEQWFGVYWDSFDHYDGFVCAYPFPFCLLWEKFNKPIYAVPCIRYEFPFSWDEQRRQWLNEGVGRMLSSGQLNVMANNQYDARYLGGKRGFPCGFTPNLCAYTGAIYTAKKAHLWTKSKVLCKGIDRIGSPFPHNHSWQDIADGLGVFFIPYNVSVMSFFEWYAAGIPIIVPSKEWLVDLGIQELAFNKELIRPSDSLAVDWADYYNSEYFPDVIKVGSIDEVRVVSKKKLLNTAEVMRIAEPARQEKILSRWRNFLFTKVETQ